jgi:hypothetical protein
MNIIGGYRIPDPLKSWEEAQRFEHLDLSGLDHLALWQERRRVEIALAFVTKESDCIWLVERLAAIRSAQRHQRESGRWK